MPDTRWMRTLLAKFHQFFQAIQGFLHPPSSESSAVDPTDSAVAAAEAVATTKGRRLPLGREETPCRLTGRRVLACPARQAQNSPNLQAIAVCSITQTDAASEGSKVGRAGRGCLAAAEALLPQRPLMTKNEIGEASACLDVSKPIRLQLS